MGTKRTALKPRHYALALMILAWSVFFGLFFGLAWRDPSEVIEAIETWLFGGWAAPAESPFWAKFLGVIPLCCIWLFSRWCPALWRAGSHPMQVASAVVGLVWTIVFWFGGAKLHEWGWDGYDLSLMSEDFRAWVFPVGLSCCVVYFMAGSAKRADERRGLGE